MNLTGQQVEVAKENLRKGRFASSTLQGKIEKGTLTDEDKEMFSSLLESYLVDTLNALGYESTLAKEKEQRYEEIRSVHQEKAELEKKLASKNPLSGFAEQFSMIQDIIQDWWRNDGFVYVSEVNMLNNGELELKLGFALSMRVSMFSEDKEADREDLARHMKSLEDMGLVFYKESEYTIFDKDLVYSSENEELLKKLIQRRFPSFEVKNVEKTEFTKRGLIESITGVITDLDDLLEEK